jgi:hypothetical protein
MKGEQDRVVAVRHLPLHHTIVSFHAGKHAPLLFTNACTTSPGHQGVNKLPLSFVDAPAFEPRGNADVRHHATTLTAGDAGLRAKLRFFFL